MLQMCHRKIFQNVLFINLSLDFHSSDQSILSFLYPVRLFISLLSVNLFHFASGNYHPEVAYLYFTSKYNEKAICEN